ncbi:Saccharopine dehydrogenase-like oxidoreductase, partial [Stegodyphus mimosarum]
MCCKCKKFDIVIFGASGLIGYYVIEELARSALTYDVKWAIAGRNVQKLHESLHVVQEYLEKSIDICGTPIIIADAQDESSVFNMCKVARLILNCAGPYEPHAENIISACIENGTHYVDLSVEIRFFLHIQARYFRSALEKNICIVQQCGFGCIPSDYGICLLREKFPGVLNSVEYYVEIGEGPLGRSTNISTFASLINMIRDFSILKSFKDLLKRKSMKKTHLLPWRGPVFYSNIVKSWCMWYINPDERVIRISNKLNLDYFNKRPVHMYGYMKMPSLQYGLFLLCVMTICLLMSFVKLGKYLLLKYPSFFTAGNFSRTGPTRQQVKEGFTKCILYGEGWEDKLPQPGDRYPSKPDKRIKLTITGPEPGYDFTSILMVQSALVILQEKARVPINGGVLTPGVAFQFTTLSERLKKR